MFQKNPHNLFLLDALGAFVTFGLNILIANLVDIFGMPSMIMYQLAIVALSMFIFSLMNFLIQKKKYNYKVFQTMLAIIISANTIYCIITGYFVFHNVNLTLIGKLYFIGEIIVVMGLVIYEILFLLNKKRASQ